MVDTLDFLILPDHWDEPIVGVEADVEGASWRLAQSLVVLRNEVNEMAPNRRKTSDGTIGDAAHRARASRHNPNRFGVVTALDLTHDPARGCDIHKLVRDMTAGGRSPHPNCAYIISNRQVARSSNGWVWVKYNGSHPHDGHAHFGVGLGSDGDPRPPYDDTTSWMLFLKKEEEDVMNAEQDKMQKLLRISAIAQSYKLEILEAKIDGDKAKAAQLVIERAKAIEDSRRHLGLLKADLPQDLQ